jgi:50S ribosomal subunit-associated GTPase HflX
MTKQSSTNANSTRTIIAALVSAKATDTDERIRSLTAVLTTRGIEVVGTIVQRRGVSRSKSPGGSKRLNVPLSSATYFGVGKAHELAVLAKEQAANVVYFLNDLSARQIQRLSALTDCEVIACADTEWLS